MQTKRWVLAAMLAATGVTIHAQEAQPAEEPKTVQTTVAVDVLSAYVWRGQTLNDGLVIQPYIEATIPAGFTVNVWANYDLGDFHDTLAKDEFSEVDLALTYTLPIEFLDLSFGWVQYLYPVAGGEDTDTAEVFAKCTWEPAEGLSLCLDLVYDYDQIDDSYLNASVSYGHGLGLEGLSAEVTVSAGYAGGRFCADGEPGFYDCSAGLAVEYAVNEAVSVSASAKYVDTLDKDKLTEEDVVTNEVYGLSVACAF